MTWLVIEQKEFGKFIEKLQNENWLAGPWRKAMDAARELVEQTAKQRAPGGPSGSVGEPINSVIDSRPVPLYAKIQLNSPVRGSFRYGGALEGGSKYHYRSGPYTGKKTRGWFRGSLAAVRKEIDKLLNDAREEIEAAWRK